MFGGGSCAPWEVCWDVDGTEPFEVFTEPRMGLRVSSGTKDGPQWLEWRHSETLERRGAARGWNQKRSPEIFFLIGQN